MPVIFNDYMKCMLCNATEEKLKPVIDIAAKIGCEYFMMDAGWYCENDWEREGGEWYPNKNRFPNGIEKVTEYIKTKGMKPGMWLEPEVVGEYSPLLKKYPDSYFFMKHGKRIHDNGRYMLDFRNKEVTDYLTGVVDRFYNQYGIRYLKLDYNMEIGAGTEINSDSLCDGLMGHYKAYGMWLENLLKKYPDLIIENCGSGGMRMNYGLLDKLSIQSVTDQEDYRLNGIIASKSATALLPEQAAFWIYPSAGADKYEVSYNMVNGILNRMHISGAVHKLDEEGLKLMADGIEYYKSIRKYINKFVPIYPLGLASFHDDIAVAGYKCENKLFFAVYNINKDYADIEIPLEYKAKNAKIAYPNFDENNVKITDCGLCVHIGNKASACIVEVEI